MKRHFRLRSHCCLVASVLGLLVAGCGGPSEGPPASAGGAASETTSPKAQTTSTNEAAASGTVSRDEVPKEAKSSSAVSSAPQAVEAPQPADAKPAAPATVHEATAAIDLRKFPQLEGAADAHVETSLLRYESPGDVESAVMFHVKHLAEIGWEEDTEGTPRRVDERNAYLGFRRDGFYLFLSVNRLPDDENAVLVTLRNQGNVDTRRLPRRADAEPLYGGQATTVYVTPVKVAEAAEFTRRELASLGWQEYKPPFAQTASDADNASLSFKQNGINLSAYIGVAPAQGGKTTVQYDTGVLNYELPTPPGASEIEYDDNLPYLKFQSPLDFDGVAQFYRDRAEAVGWSAKNDLTDARDDSMTLFFDGEGERLFMLQLAKGDAQGTLVTLQSVLTQADDAAELPAGPAEAAVAEPAGTTKPVVKLTAKDLPIAKDAREMEVDADEALIRYKSPSKLDPLVQFYRKALTEAGWKEDKDFAVVQEAVVAIDFENEGASLSINAFNDGIGGDTEVTLSATGVSFDESPAASEPAVARSDVEKPLELELRGGLPVPTNETGFASSGSRFRREMNVTTPSPIEAVLAKYREELAALGWKEEPEAQKEGETGTPLRFKNDEGELSVAIKRADGETAIDLVAKMTSAAKQAGILPEAGKARIIVVNDSESKAAVVINEQTLEAGAGVGTKKPDGPTLHLSPGKYKLRVTLEGKEPKEDEIELGPDETWSVIVTADGPVSLHMY